MTTVNSFRVFMACWSLLQAGIDICYTRDRRCLCMLTLDWFWENSSVCFTGWHKDFQVPADSLERLWGTSIPSKISIIIISEILDSRFQQTANGRSDHVTMISPRLPFTVCHYLVKVSRFVFAINTKIILHYSRNMLIIYFEETWTGLWRLPFAGNESLDLSIN